METNKVKLLVIGMSLNVGGAEKSMVNFLNMVDYRKYSVDLLLFQEKGAFLKQVPHEINVVRIREITVLYQSIFDTIKMDDISFNDLKFSVKRYIATLIEKTKWKQFDRARIHRWLDYYRDSITKNCKHYDVGIAFMGGETAYYLIDKVNCDRKVYFFHSDYSKIDIDVSLEESYIKKADQIIAVSDTCKNSLKTLFPCVSKKIDVLQNLSSSKLIGEMSRAYYPEEFKKKHHVINVVSIGRLHKIKGYDMAIAAAKILVQKGISFRWFIVGDGTERRELMTLIKKNGLEGTFVLMGLRENPYPYILNADVIVQPSRFEGKSVVLDEAKLLKKIIIATNYNSIEDQIDNHHTGLIVDMSPEGIAEGIEEILTNEELRNNILQNLCDKDIGDIGNINHYLSTIVGVSEK